jgi:hypothetical protein
LLFPSTILIASTLDIVERILLILSSISGLMEVSNA